VSYRSNDDIPLIFVKDHTPFTDPKPHPLAPSKTLQITMPGLGELHQSFVDPIANIGRELRPLSACSRKGNWPHTGYIAYRDI
jgi:hypothetical protein